jgi:adenine-specific DNA-methyltransferase
LECLHTGVNWNQPGPIASAEFCCFDKQLSREMAKVCRRYGREALGFMEGKVGNPLDTERPWQADLCQFFTREKVAELCLLRVTFPKNLLSMRLLEPAAGQGAFFLPLLARLVRSCRRQRKSFDALRPIIRAYEIDAESPSSSVCKQGQRSRRSGSMGPRRAGSRATGFETKISLRPGRGRASRILSAILHNIRWDAIPGSLRESYRARFASFKQRADLYVAFIEHALSLLHQHGSGDAARLLGSIGLMAAHSLIGGLT